VHEQRDVAAPLLEVDLDAVGVFRERTGAVLDDGAGAGADDAVALGADLVVVVEVVALVAALDAVARRISSSKSSSS
jgi:hypothetical protein